MYHIPLACTCVLISLPSVWILVAMLSVESVVRDYHVYMDNWSPSVGDDFELEVEQLNRHDRYAVAIKVSGDIVSHVPCEFSKIVHYCIKNCSRSGLRTLRSNNLRTFTWSTNRALF